MYGEGGEGKEREGGRGREREGGRGREREGGGREGRRGGGEGEGWGLGLHCNISEMECHGCLLRTQLRGSAAILKLGFKTSSLMPSTRPLTGNW